VKLEGVITTGQAEERANEIIRPLLPNLNIDQVNALVLGISNALREESLAAYQRGLDHITLGGKPINVKVA
jgi:hypothetical protein